MTFVTIEAIDSALAHKYTSWHYKSWISCFNGNCLKSVQGVEVDRMDVDAIDVDKKSTANCNREPESVELSALIRQQKHLHNLTEHALRKNQPLIISNLLHEKNTLLTAENLTGASKTEQTCLQALSIIAFDNDLVIEISIEDMKCESQEACESNSARTPPVPTASTTLDSELPTIVSSIPQIVQPHKHLL